MSRSAHMQSISPYPQPMLGAPAAVSGVIEGLFCMHRRRSWCTCFSMRVRSTSSPRGRLQVTTCNGLLWTQPCCQLEWANYSMHAGCRIEALDRTCRAECTARD